ncbi:hypothetical protein ABZS66_02800 [Dactylosporangium sp. NPDC005572]|uniref:hypothetical protein n=1 Tax=Dactylosporangium sp. NPDC005572 TaxID=3156889 RepID=UPI00339E3504
MHIDLEITGRGERSAANPIRGPLNRIVLRSTEGYAHRLLGRRKAALFAGLPRFADVSIQRYRMRSVFLPINPQIAGVATR